MTAFVALLRAVNVGGTGKLAMTDLKAIGEECGFGKVRTFIASGNLLFTSASPEKTVQRQISDRIGRHFGKPVGLFVRSAAEMAEAVERNPFTDDKPSRVMAYFIDGKPIQAMIDEARDVNDERLALGPRVVYVSYGAGIAKTKLKIPSIRQGTSRNMNSVKRMADLLAGMA